MKLLKVGTFLNITSGAYDCFEKHKSLVVVIEFDLDQVKDEHLANGNDKLNFHEFYDYLLSKKVVVPFEDVDVHLGDWELGDKRWSMKERS